jgi:hypothetical protein
MPDLDPYEPPAERAERGADAEDAADAERAGNAAADVRLYAPWAVTLCGVLFGPVVGCGVAATNYARVGERHKAQQMWAVGIACFLVLLGIAAFSESATLIRGAEIGGTVGLASSLRRDQKRLVDEHVAAGARLDSPLVPIVAGVAFVAALLGALYALA